MTEAFMGGSAESHLFWWSILHAKSRADQHAQRLIFADWLEESGREAEAQWQRFMVQFYEDNGKPMLSIVTQWKDMSRQVYERSWLWGLNSTDFIFNSRDEIERWEGLMRIVQGDLSVNLPLLYLAEKAAFEAWAIKNS